MQTQKSRIITKELSKKIDSKLLPTLKNRSTSHNRFIITFSGVPGTGKTTIAKILEKRYSAVKINNDAIRKIIVENHLTTSEEETEQLLQEYNFNLISKIPFRNKRLILDKSMDRRYKWFLGICTRCNLNYFLIRLTIPDESKALAMLSKREEITNTERTSMKRWFKEYLQCTNDLNANITLDAINPDMNKLFNLLDTIFCKDEPKARA